MVNMSADAWVLKPHNAAAYTIPRKPFFITALVFRDGGPRFQRREQDSVEVPRAMGNTTQSTSGIGPYFRDALAKRVLDTDDLEVMNVLAICSLRQSTRCWCYSLFSRRSARERR